ncbi:hypothetical protein [Bacillus sp. NPDC094106]|uniref:hypothetical protein n=1 Tax=Bacillus sp. NPDC094106 TaxID=3363949 RepID=UPI003824460F
MKQLTEENFDLCQQYLNMISEMEEGFEYVIASFTDFSKTEGDLVLSEIFRSLNRIAHTNLLFEQLFSDDESLQQAITNFSDVADAAFMLDGNFDDYGRKMNVINEYLYPAFSAWRNTVQSALVQYVMQ